LNIREFRKGVLDVLLTEESLDPFRVALTAAQMGPVSADHFLLVVRPLVGQGSGNIAN
jgi:hypothetical protein